jgi:hypothetical protein
MEDDLMSRENDEEPGLPLLAARAASRRIYLIIVTAHIEWDSRCTKTVTEIREVYKNTHRD